MYYMARVFPILNRVKLPLTRDQLMLLMAAVNLFFLGLDIYLAHSISGTIVPYEWIPIIFGPFAGVLLLVAGIVALRKRDLATVIANVIFLTSVAVGLLGAYFHVVRAVLPTGPIGARVNVDLLVWAPPVLGPLTFSLVGLIGISAVWLEDPADSGRLALLSKRRIQLPYSKTQAYLFIVGLGTLATLISSVLDHARTNFHNPWLWVPITAGVFGTVVAAALGSMDRPSRGDIIVYVSAMVLLLITGVVGAVLHIQEDLTAQGTFVLERFIRGAPFLAPLLFANMGTLGLIVLLDPRESPTETNI
ncbi:MAG: hypothetical protein KAJ55_05135 [Anaerolineales bacterium]|jgi:hypothetical protein|nr:hypothetical protein [Anaerolineales bacterium]